MLWKEGQQPRVEIEGKCSPLGKLECFQWKVHGQCCRRRLLFQSWQNRLWQQWQWSETKMTIVVVPQQIRRQRLTVKKATEMKALTKGVRFWSNTEIAKLCHVKIWHIPVCQICRFESWCTYGDKSHFRHVEAEEKPNKKSKKGGAKWSVPPLGLCVSRFLSETIWFCMLGSKHADKFSKGTWHRIKIGERKGPSRGISQCVRLMSVVFARSNSRRDHMRRRCTKKDAPADQREIWRKIFTSSRIRTKLRFTLLLKGG